MTTLTSTQPPVYPSIHRLLTFAQEVIRIFSVTISASILDLAVVKFEAEPRRLMALPKPVKSQGPVRS